MRKRTISLLLALAMLAGLGLYVLPAPPVQAENAGKYISIMVGAGQIGNGEKGNLSTPVQVLEKGRGGYDFAAAREDMDWNKEKVKLIECINM